MFELLITNLEIVEKMKRFINSYCDFHVDLVLTPTFLQLKSIIQENVYNSLEINNCLFDQFIIFQETSYRIETLMVKNRFHMIDKSENYLKFNIKNHQLIINKTPVIILYDKRITGYPSNFSFGLTVELACCLFSKISENPNGCVLDSQITINLNCGYIKINDHVFFLDISKLIQIVEFVQNIIDSITLYFGESYIFIRAGDSSIILLSFVIELYK